MRTRWIDLCRRLGAPDLAEALWITLEALYLHPKREYHTIGHAAACVEHLQSLPADYALADRDAAELALWLHDCVYVPGSPRNELLSAEIARAFCNVLKLSPARIGAVEEMILATRHLGTPLTGDPAIVADIDLSSIGSPPVEFARGSIAIDREYAGFDPDIYRGGRIKFVTGMLDRAQLFHHPLMRQRFETQGRTNLRSELARLQRGEAASARATNSEPQLKSSTM